jgi:2-dehydro-3-deoxygalactonokinase
MADKSQPGLIALDWGTSSLRAYLLDCKGAVHESSSWPWGIQNVPGSDFVAMFRAAVGGWRQRWPSVPAIAAGMIGSRQGWREVPYVDCPTDPAGLVAGLLAFDTGCGTLHIVPGVMQRGELPNVLRGEETQILGALALEPALADHSLLVLPGTHSKWVSICKGRIERFATYMTGELFAVLRDHSILGRPARDSGPAAGGPMHDEAFRRGLRVARESGSEGVACRLFTTRSLFLAGDLPAAQTLDYLSGLLIGEEIRSVVAELGGAARPPLVLIGEPALCGRYAAALKESGCNRVRILENTAPAGLWQIAGAAGLLPAGGVTPPRNSSHA